MARRKRENWLTKRETSYTQKEEMLKEWDVSDGAMSDPPRMTDAQKYLACLCATYSEE